MAESLLAAALAAGVVEGASILSNNNAQQSANGETSQSFHGAAIAMSSVLYGTAALPLTLVGASPGPAILSSLPAYCPPPPKNESIEEMNHVTPMNTTETVPNNNPPRRAPPLQQRHNRIKDSETTESSLLEKQKEESQHDKRSELIHRTREENRKMIAAIREKRQQQREKGILPRSSTPTKTKPFHQSIMNRYFATLDGKPLPTPLAEGMRRSRILLVGAGLVTLLISNQSRNKTDEGENNVRAALEEFVRKQPNGVAIRLMRDRLMVQNNNNAVVPFVMWDAASGAADIAANKPPLYWNLGRTAEEWKQIPLSEHWLLHPSGGTTGDNGKGSKSSTAPLLVIEADVSIPLSASVGTANAEEASDNKLLTMDSARFMSRVIDTVAQQNGVIPSPSVVTILVGSDDRMLSTREENEIYIEGHSAVAAKVASFAEGIYTDLVSKQVSDDVETVKSQDNADVESGGGGSAIAKLVSYIDNIGEKIRQGGVTAVKAANSVVAHLAGNDRVIFVFSDNRNIATWIRSKMPGWSIVWLDVSSSQSSVDSISQHGGIAVVCCDNDETTSNFVCSMLSSNDSFAKETSVLAILQQQQSATTLNWLVEDFALRETQPALCVSTESIENIHNTLFAQAQELLASGKTPMEIQEIMNDN